MGATIKKLLIANRGEIAIRIARTAAELGIATVSIHSEDDAQSLHSRKTDETRGLKGSGVAPYLDAAQILAIAKDTGCQAVHPGYGFLSENADFARGCEQAGLIFVGPSAETLALFGDKGRALALARQLKVPVLPGTQGATSLDQAQAFLASLGEGGGVMVKALAGGGGRGMRPVLSAKDLPAAFERCGSEAQQAFGNGDLYIEKLYPRARHIEVQIVGDGTGAVSHLWDRDCSVQRQRQKLIEIAPAPHLDAGLRRQLLDAAIRMGQAARYRGVATIEFLVDASPGQKSFAFIEANPRLQVEHTVTEEVLGLDIVRLQLEIAAGKTLAQLGITQDKVPAPRGMALQARINMETMAADGSSRPGGGTLAAFDPPSGPGVRVDTFGYTGYRTSARFDSLLAKLIVHVGQDSLPAAAAKAYRALGEFRIAGAPTNISFLQSLLRHPDVMAGKTHTRFVDEKIGELIGGDNAAHRKFFFDDAATAKRAGVRVDSGDPLAVLALGKEGAVPAAADVVEPDRLLPEAPEGSVSVNAPVQGTIVSLAVSEGQAVRAGDAVLVMEAMKMEHVVEAAASGIVQRITVAAGETVYEDHPLLFIVEAEIAETGAARDEQIDLDHIRPDLAETLSRQAKLEDAARPEAVARRRKTGQRTARENIAQLCDPGSFHEFGGLTVAARRTRHSLEELIDRTPADGMVMGIGRINGDKFGDEAARAVAVSYDYTVLAGTQGQKNHHKKDRMFEIAEHYRLPLVFFTEGGGGRPGDTDAIIAGDLHIRTFQDFGRLSALVPLIGVTSGRCFAGNAVLLGCCDVIIATENSNIGMGGPAMIEGGGLGVFRPEEVGPMSVQVPNGVVDIPVRDEIQAVEAAKKYLSYFQGALKEWTCADQRLLRRAVPENRLRVYDVRQVIETLCDAGSVLELRGAFGPGMITSLARIEGRPIGIIANNPKHLGGAIDSDGADKATRFMQLCDAFDIPLLFLCDTPGNMVGPEAERTGLVRHCCRVFVTAANITVPFFTVVLRKAYGLGAQGMAGGSFHAPFFSVSWPTGEFGGMGLEGAVKLGFRNELAAIDDPAKRKSEFDRMVAGMYERGKALSAASLFEIDNVIDPATTRDWVLAGLRSVPAPPKRIHKKRPNIDTW
jgi:acetyl/propionyl-CoA carboxylase alpha subunit/acetyl-CoA carboxylase carboxyltransferase component